MHERIPDVWAYAAPLDDVVDALLDRVLPTREALDCARLDWLFRLDVDRLHGVDFKLHSELLPSIRFL